MAGVAGQKAGRSCCLSLSSRVGVRRTLSWLWRIFSITLSEKQVPFQGFFQRAAPTV